MRAMRTLIAVSIAGAGLGVLPPRAEGAELVVEPGLDTLKEAVAAASPGDTLLLEPGLYEVGSTVLIDKDLSIRGKGDDPRDVHIAAVDAEEFDFQEAIFTEEIDRGHILFATAGARKVSFAYFTIQNAPETDIDEGLCVEEPPLGLGLNLSECFGDAIHADGVARVVVEHVRANLNAGNGVWVDGAEKVRIRRFSATNNGAFGVDVDSALYLSIRDSRFVANQISGVEASGHPKGTQRADYTAEVVVEDTLAAANGEIGVEVERFKKARLKRVTSQENREDGFDADRVGEVVISRSSFLDNLGDGLELFPVDVPPEEQPADFPGSIVEKFFELDIEGNVGEEINRPPTEN